MIMWVFPALAMCGIFFAYCLKIHFSGSGLNKSKLFSA